MLSPFTSCSGIEHDGNILFSHIPSGRNSDYKAGLLLFINMQHSLISLDTN